MLLFLSGQSVTFAQDQVKVKRIFAPDVENVIFVLDCSLSMNENLEHKMTKWSYANKIIEQSLKIVPVDKCCALRVFGQSAEDPCQATKLLVPFKKNNKHKILAILKVLRPTGQSPLTMAVREMFEGELNNLTKKTIVIMVIDGSDTCGHAPEAYAKAHLIDRTYLPPVVILNMSPMNSPRAMEQSRWAATCTDGLNIHYSQMDKFFQALKELRGARTAD